MISEPVSPSPLHAEARLHSHRTHDLHYLRSPISRLRNEHLKRSIPLLQLAGFHRRIGWPRQAGGGEPVERVVVDDFAMAAMAENERRDFWEICEDRYQEPSLILTSQLPPAQWYEQIGDTDRCRSHSRPDHAQRSPHRTER